MHVRIIKSHRDIVAICDSELLGKKFEEGDFQLDLKENFYRGEEMNEIQVAKVIRRMAAEDATFNIIGEKSINTAIKTGILSKEEIKTIDKIPFAMIFL